jgi:hypothetical protein
MVVRGGFTHDLANNGTVVLSRPRPRAQVGGLTSIFKLESCPPMAPGLLGRQRRHRYIAVFEQLSGESPLTVCHMWAAGIKTQWGAERLIRGRECRGGSRTIRLQPPTLRRGWRSSRIASSPQANRFGLEADPSSGPAWASAPAHRTARGVHASSQWARPGPHAPRARRRSAWRGLALSARVPQYELYKRPRRSDALGHFAQSEKFCTDWPPR